MHASLTITANFTAQALSGAVLAVALLVFKPTHAEIVLLPFALGALAGWFQSKVVLQSSDAFRDANSSSAIRALLTAAPSGRWSIGLLWLNGLGALTLMATDVIRPATAVAAFAAFTLAREMVCLPAIRRLSNSMKP